MSMREGERERRPEVMVGGGERETLDIIVESVHRRGRGNAWAVLLLGKGRGGRNHKPNTPPAGAAATGVTAAAGVLMMPGYFYYSDWRFGVL